jgi:hypothetical protein
MMQMEGAEETGTEIERHRHTRTPFLQEQLGVSAIRINHVCHPDDPSGHSRLGLTTALKDDVVHISSNSTMLRKPLRP